MDTTAGFIHDLNSLKRKLARVTTTTTLEGGVAVPWTDLTPLLLNGWKPSSNWPAPAFCVTEDGLVHLRGCITGGSLSAVAFIVPDDYGQTSPADYFNVLQFPVCVGAGFGRVEVAHYGDVYVMPPSGTTDVHLDGMCWVSALASPTWTFFSTLDNSYASYSTTTDLPRYTLLDSGLVVLAGRLTGPLNTDTSTSEAFYMPVGLQPVAMSEPFFASVQQSASSTFRICETYVDDSFGTAAKPGGVWPFFVGAPASGFKWSWWLDGVIYPIK
jgi:hypothetical protein